MEYLDGYYTIPENSSTQVQQQKYTAMDKMHQKGYVHADLCDRNILIKYSNDYDWADENGKTIYLAFLNLGIPHYHDASPGDFIMKEHDDEFMVNKFKN
ncbi:11049_t:CDS:2 [Entrophospora sp. SA101]|nr:11049_t:CDS:2 [Entrophospora sp. SA101]